MIKDPLKSPKLGIFKRFGAAFIAAEGLGLFGSYFVWRKLNRDQDFRLTAYHSYPWALEMYYKMGEAIEPENKIREFDLMVWQREGRLEMK